MLRILNPHGVSTWHGYLKDLNRTFERDSISLTQLSSRNIQYIPWWAVSWVEGPTPDYSSTQIQINWYDKNYHEWVNTHSRDLSKPDSHLVLKWLLLSLLAVIIYYPEKAEMAIKTKAWASCCTNLGSISMHFVIISVCSSWMIKEKEKQKDPSMRRVFVVIDTGSK